MSVAEPKYGTVVRATMTKADDMDGSHPASSGPKVNGIPVMRVEFEYDGETHYHDIPNGEFLVVNPTLQFLAFVGKKPSDFDGQTLDFSHTEVPVLRNGEDSYALSNDVLEMGADRLEDVVWSPAKDYSEDDEDGGETPHSGSGGGDDDGDGSATKGTVESEDVDVTAEYDTVEHDISLVSE